MKTILHIEDDLSHCKLVENLLATRRELEVHAAREGNLGLAFAQRHHPDLILLDLQLVGLQGDEVLHRLKNDHGTRQIPVVVISADATPRTAGRLLQSGASAYLTKPFDINELLEAVDEALSEQTGT